MGGGHNELGVRDRVVIAPSLGNVSVWPSDVVPPTTFGPLNTQLVLEDLNVNLGIRETKISWFVAYFVIFMANLIDNVFVEINGRTSLLIAVGAAVILREVGIEVLIVFLPIVLLIC